ncbi:MAG: DUF559 domain-containing protein [Actinomycetes bacterium]
MPRTSAVPLKVQFTELAARQNGVLSRKQISALGGDPHLIARRRAAKVWQAVGPHVVVLHTGPLSPQQQRWAAVLHAGASAALFGLSALQADGLRGFDSPVLHVVAVHGKGRRELESEHVHIKVHESLHLGPERVHPTRTPPRQRPARAAVDAASLATTDGRARAVIAAVVQQGLVRPADLRLAVLADPTLPGRALILETVGDVAGGAHSLPELEWNRGLRQIGLPTPTRQRKVRHANGYWYLDADFDEWLVTVEINGAQHLDHLSRDVDDERRFVVSAGGRLMVDIASYVVRRELDRAMLRTARALGSRGWQPDEIVTGRLQRLADSRGEALWLPPLVVPDLSPSA